MIPALVPPPSRLAVPVYFKTQGGQFVRAESRFSEMALRQCRATELHGWERDQVACMLEIRTQAILDNEPIPNFTGMP